ncbi:MAG: hypothetical protein V3R81_00945 [Gammaproteobacteria bacterium]
MIDTLFEAVLAMIGTIFALVILMAPRRPSGGGINPLPDHPKPENIPGLPPKPKANITKVI